MTKSIAGMTMSLDGFVHDARGSTEAPSRDLADWRNEERSEASMAATGAVLMGRRTFEMAVDPDSYADQYEYRVPSFVLTGHPPAGHPKESSGLTFTFVAGGLDSAIAQDRWKGRRDHAVQRLHQPLLLGFGQAQEWIVLAGSRRDGRGGAGVSWMVDMVNFLAKPDPPAGGPTGRGREGPARRLPEPRARPEGGSLRRHYDVKTSTIAPEVYSPS